MSIRGHSTESSELRNEYRQLRSVDPSLLASSGLCCRSSLRRAVPRMRALPGSFSTNTCHCEYYCMTLSHTRTVLYYCTTTTSRVNTVQRMERRRILGRSFVRLRELALFSNSSRGHFMYYSWSPPPISLFSRTVCQDRNGVASRQS